MIAEILNEAVSDAQTVKSLVLAGEKLRTFVSSNDAQHVELRGNPTIVELVAEFPDVVPWRMLDHCACLTRLYAIFERFVGKTVRAWLADAPNLWGSYRDLGESFGVVHRRGVARVLMDLDKDRFSHLNVNAVLEGLMEAVNGVAGYSVLPEAFLSDIRSLKRERVEELFTQVRIEGGWDWISKHRFVVSYMNEMRGGQNTPEAELRSFVNYRNEAAHGAVDQVLGVVPLTEFADFIVVVCRTIDEMVRWNWVRLCRATGRAHVIGEVTERFRNNVIVAKMQNCAVSEKMELLLFGPHYCYTAVVESIQLDDVPFVSLDVGPETEIGLKLNVPSQKHPQLIVIPKE
jgi:hypothetical protein